jgi:hypothetical protein
MIGFNLVSFVCSLQIPQTKRPSQHTRCHGQVNEGGLKVNGTHQVVAFDVNILVEVYILERKMK